MRRNRITEFVEEIIKKEENRKRKGDFILRRSSDSITEKSLKINFLNSSIDESPLPINRSSFIPGYI